MRRLERLRQEFVANVSHELKTPLAVIKANIETLLEGAVEDRQHRGRFLEQIANQADRLHALILDMLSLAQIESGTEAFEYHAVSLNEAIRSCLERQRARAEAKLADIEEKIRGLHAMKKTLARFVAACSGRGPVSACPILEALDEEGVNIRPRTKSNNTARR